MADPDGKKSTAKWFWILILAALFILLLAWFRNPLGDVEGVPEPEPTAPSSEWVEPNPTEPAVPVTLPETGGEEPTGGEGSSSGAGD